MFWMRILLTLVIAVPFVGSIVMVLKDINEERHQGFHMDWGWRLAGLMISLCGGVLIAIVWLTGPGR